MKFASRTGHKALEPALRQPSAARPTTSTHDQRRRSSWARESSPGQGLLPSSTPVALRAQPVPFSKPPSPSAAATSRASQWVKSAVRKVADQLPHGPTFAIVGYCLGKNSVSRISTDPPTSRMGHSLAIACAAA